jgi:hypothetical protein
MSIYTVFYWHGAIPIDALMLKFSTLRENKCVLLFIYMVLFRLVFTFLVATSFHPDEFFQTVEPSYRAVYGYSMPLYEMYWKSSD